MYQRFSPPGFCHSLEQILEEKQIYQYDNFPCPVLSEEYELIWKIFSVLYDCKQASIPYHTLLDIYFLLLKIDNIFDWPNFFQRRQKEGILSITTQVLNFTLGFFQCSDNLIKLEQALKETGVSRSSVTQPRRPFCSRHTLYAWLWKIAGAPIHQNFSAQNTASLRIFGIDDKEKYYYDKNNLSAN